jgi:hypothetical protein
MTQLCFLQRVPVDHGYIESFPEYRPLAVSSERFREFEDLAVGRGAVEKYEVSED